MKYLVLFGILIFTFACRDRKATPQENSIHSGDDTANASSTPPQVMNGMVTRLKSIPFTGNNDRDFATMMMEYHDGAIDMARHQTYDGNNAELQEFSKAVVADLKQELLSLADFIKKEPAQKSSSSQKFQQTVATAISRMTTKNLFGQTDMDHQFVMLMINHHEAGLQMLRAELDHGSHQTMKIAARNMLAKQSEELRWLKTWLSKN